MQGNWALRWDQLAVAQATLQVLETGPTQVRPARDCPCVFPVRSYQQACPKGLARKEEMREDEFSGVRQDPAGSQKETGPGGSRMQRVGMKADDLTASGGPIYP
jgi:hypothetical protein